MEKRFLIPGTDLSVYPIGLGTVDAGLRWDAQTLTAFLIPILARAAI